MFRNERTIFTYLFLLLSFVISQGLFARASYKSSKNYVLENNDEYDFKSCQKYNDENADEFSYYLKCIEGTLSQVEKVDELQKDIGAIEATIYRNNFLQDIKSQTIESLQLQQGSLTKILKCFSSDKSTECEEIKEALVTNTLSELTSMREVMALMEEPSMFRTDRKRKYTIEIEHEIGNTDIPPLTILEIKKLEARQEFIDKELEQKWFKTVAHKNKCVTQDSNGLYQLKNSFKGLSCESIMRRYINIYKDDEVEKIREKSKKIYFEKLDKYPILSKLKHTGDASKEDIAKTLKEEIKNNLAYINTALNKTISLKKHELPDLIKNENIVNNYLNKNGPGRILCDISQEFSDKLFYDELKTDLFIAGASIIGGGICGLTAGLGCLVGVGLVAEATSLYVSDKRESDENLLFYTGLSTSKKLSSREDDFTLTLIVAPLAIGGEFIGSTIKVAKSVAKEVPTNQLVPSEQIIPAQQLIPTDKLTPDDAASLANKKKLLEKKTSKIEINSTEDLIHQFLNFDLANPRLNARWIDSASKDASAFYLDIENAAMKRINDTLGDKNLVTALTNLHKEVTNTKIAEVINKYPEISFEVYSDFKSVRYSFGPKDMPEDLKKEILKDLNSAYVSANEEFELLIKNVDIPKTETPKNWFLAGSSTTADEAGLASKKSRSLTRTDQSIIDFKSVESIIKSQQKNIVSIQSKIINDVKLTNANLISKISNDQATLSEEVIDLLRKYPEKLEAKDIANARAQLSKEYGADLSSSDVKMYIDYVHDLNSLTPGLWLAKREIANLDNAILGGLTGDVTGLGSKNIQQVAYNMAYATQNNLDMSDTVKVIREGEKTVTKEFNSIKNNFDTSVRGHLQERGISHTIKCSGDDCAVVLKEAITPEQQKELINLFAKQENPSQFRMSFIPDGVEASARSKLAVHGEMLEKILRKSIRGTAKDLIPPEVLKNITIATAMPRTLNNGGIEIILGSKTQVDHETVEIINKNLREAINKVNKELESNYLPITIKNP